MSASSAGVASVQASTAPTALALGDASPALELGDGSGDVGDAVADPVTPALGLGAIVPDGAEVELFPQAATRAAEENGA